MCVSVRLLSLYLIEQLRVSEKRGRERGNNIGARDDALAQVTK